MSLIPIMRPSSLRSAHGIGFSDHRMSFSMIQTFDIKITQFFSCALGRPHFKIPLTLVKGFDAQRILLRIKVAILTDRCSGIGFSSLLEGTVVQIASAFLVCCRAYFACRDVSRHVSTSEIRTATHQKRRCNLHNSALQQ